MVVVRREATGAAHLDSMGGSTVQDTAACTGKNMGDCSKSLLSLFKFQHPPKPSTQVVAAQHIH